MKFGSLSIREKLPIIFWRPVATNLTNCIPLTGNSSARQAEVIWGWVISVALMPYPSATKESVSGRTRDLLIISVHN